MVGLAGAQIEDMPAELQILALARVLSQTCVGHQRFGLQTMANEIRLRSRLKALSHHKKVHISHMTALAQILSVQGIPVAAMNNTISATGFSQSHEAASPSGLSLLQTTPRTQSAALLSGTE